MVRPRPPREAIGKTVVTTALGPIRLEWSEAGLTHVGLPDTTVEQSTSTNPVPADHPAFVATTTELLQAYAAGERVDFNALPIDIDGFSDFECQVYDASRRLGWGETTTYGAMATSLGDPGLARAVGQALGRNPVPIVVPCHRIHAAGSRTGGFSAPGGAVTKTRLLALERAGDTTAAPLLAMMLAAEARPPAKP
jgi:methylated-DNA-[protein]-cysteine S-methyltransferase